MIEDNGSTTKSLNYQFFRSIDSYSSAVGCVAEALLPTADPTTIVHTKMPPLLMRWLTDTSPISEQFVNRGGGGIRGDVDRAVQFSISTSLADDVVMNAPAVNATAPVLAGKTLALRGMSEFPSDTTFPVPGADGPGIAGDTMVH